MFVGALLFAVLVALLDTKSLAVLLFIGGTLSLFVTPLTFLTVAMGNPFRGYLSVSPDAFRTVRDVLMRD